MNNELKAKLINNLKIQLPQMSDIELAISKDELAHYLWKKERRSLGFHPILRMQMLKGIKRYSNREILTLMYQLIITEIKRRNK